MASTVARRQHEPFARLRRPMRSADPAACNVATHEEPAGGLAGMVLGLQRSVGNAATAALLMAGQPKLVVGAAGDRYEREADEIARVVVGRLARRPHDGSSATHGGEHEHEHENEHQHEVQGTQRAGRISLRREAEVGAAGGEVAETTEQAIHAARRGGSPLDPATRTSMEVAFGADFSGVRLHAGPEAAALNERVQAKAFTVGGDIMFRDGLPDAGSHDGQALLAHELTHTIQQGAAGAASPGASVARQVSVQRMAFMNTRWQDAIDAKVSAGGTLGVLLMNDAAGPPAVVKAGETFTAEAIVAANMLNSVAGGQKSGAPEARPVDEAEAKEIHARAKALLEAKNGKPLSPMENRREHSVLEKLEAGRGVMVYGYAKGEDLGDAFTGKKDDAGNLDPNKQTKKGAFGKRKLREGSASHAFFKSPDMMAALGRAAAADVVLGNFDRLIGTLSLQNVMIDLESGKLIWIDNVHAGSWAVLATQIAKTGRAQGAEDGVKEWANRLSVKDFVNGDFAKMADRLLGQLQNELGPGGLLVNQMRQEDQAAVSKTFLRSRSMLKRWFADGMTAGKTQALRTLKDVDTLIAGVPEDMKVEVATSLIARRLVLEGRDPSQAWAAAGRRLPKGLRPKKRRRGEDKTDMPEPVPPPEDAPQDSGD